MAGRDATALTAPAHLEIRGLVGAVGRILLVFLLAFMALKLVSQWHSVIDAKAAQIREPQKPGGYEDYVVFYSAGQMALHGRGSDLYDVKALQSEQAKDLGRPISGPIGDGVLPFFNPPFLAAALAPLAALPVGTFAGVIFAIVVALTVIAGIGIDRMLDLRKPLEHTVFALWYLSLASITFMAIQSQLSMLPLLGWLGFAFFEMRGRHTTAGLSLGLILVKPQLAIVAVAVLLWKRQWQTLCSLAAVATGLVVISVAVAGPAILLDYPRFLIQSSGWENEKGVILANMYGWSGFYARTLGGAGLLHTALTYGSIAATLGVVAWTMRGAWLKSEAVLPAVALMLPASLLISLHLYRQDLSMLALVVALCAAYSKRVTGTWGVWPAIGIALWFVQFYGPRFLFEHNLNIQTPAVLMLMLAAGWLAAPRAVAVAETPRPALQQAA